MDTNQTGLTKPGILPLIPLTPTLMVMPGVWVRVRMDATLSARAMLKDIRTLGLQYAFATMADPKVTKQPDCFYKVGVIVEITQATKKPFIILRPKYRAEILNIKKNKDTPDGYWVVDTKNLEDENNDQLFIDPELYLKLRADLIKVRDLLQMFLYESVGVYQYDPDLLSIIIDDFENLNFHDSDEVSDFIWKAMSSIPNLNAEEKQPFIESTSLAERISRCIKQLKLCRQILSNYKKDENLKSKINSDDLGNNDDKFVAKAHPDIKERWKKFLEIKEFMNEDAQKVVKQDIKKLKSIGSSNSEWGMFLSRLDFILDWPWREETKEETDISKVEQELENSHAHLGRVKTHIYDYLSSKMLNPRGRSDILCFVGPPGVGKSSIGAAMAKALNLKFIRLSVGGERDESEIKGHRITYIGSKAGKIADLIRRAEVKNPLFMIDEVDKMESSIRGDPSSALLEVLDPEQNHAFSDRYVDAPLDLSHVFFVCTANVEYNIPPALRDRMNIIRLPGYLEFEKVDIARKFLIPKACEAVGLKQNNVSVTFSDDLISKIIRGYTSEAGVRNLERKIVAILRKIANSYLKSKNTGKLFDSVTLTEEMIENFLDPAKFLTDRARPTVAGEAIGLVWTSVGGDIIFVQCQLYPKIGSEKMLSQTGNLGKILRESNKKALTIIKTRLASKPEIMKKLNSHCIQIDIPDSAIPKDGPSAGITTVVSLYSELTRMIVKPFIAMTGEITIKEKIRPVGGIREKIIAAERAGIQEVILPLDNKKDLHDVPQSVKDKLHFHFVSDLEEVLKIIFPDQNGKNIPV